MRNRSALLFVIFALLAASLRLRAQTPSTSSIETVAGASSSGVAGTEFSFGSVAGLATDALGNTYFTLQSLSQVFRLSPDGRVTAYAGSGVRGMQDENVLAITSPLQGPASLAVDAAGNLFIASGKGLVRVDAASGMLSTVLKTPYRQPGSADSTLSINSMAMGPDGNLYIADGRDFRIKSYSLASGLITVLAGNGTLGPTRPGAPATSSPLRHPNAIAVGPDGTVYFSTMEPAVFRIRPENSVLEKINLRLKKEPPVGEYNIPSHIAVDSSGHLFVAQANRSRVLRIDLKSGKVAAYAGTGNHHFTGDGIRAAKANITAPNFVALDASGSLIIADQYRIRRVNAATTVIATVVGNGLPGGSAAKSTPALQARLWEPAYAIPAPDGSAYITSSFSHRLLQVDTQGNLTTAAGGGNPVSGERPGPALQVALDYPQGIWLDDDGDVYFSDHDNRLVRRLSTDAKSVTNFATTPKNTNSAGVFLHYAAALVADTDYFYMSDPTGHRVWRISRRDGSVEPYAGTGSTAPGDPEPQNGDGGDAKSARLLSPSGLALDAQGNLFIADGGYIGRRRGRILRVDAANGKITAVLLGLQQPSGLAFESPGVLCFSEAGGHQVRCLDLSNNTTRVVAGTGVAGFSGDGGLAECAQLNRPSGISFDGMGNLYIADTGNQRVRRVRPGRGLVQCDVDGRK